MPHKPFDFSVFENSFVYLFLLVLVVAAYCGWVLSLPLFPTVDGPMHLYFMHVLQSVLVDPHSFYGQFYYVRHVLPPYALYYYALMLLTRVVPVLLADKIIVCLYFVSFAFGFRYLARAIGSNGDVMALLATVLLLNWPLGMGFVNFCLSTSFALWALGLWCRAAARKDNPRKIGFVLLAYLIMLTHPVPLLAVLGFCVAELCVRLFHDRSRNHAERPTFFPQLWLTDALYIAAATVSLAYVRLFTVSNMLHQVHPAIESPVRHEIVLLRGFVLLHSLMVFVGKTPLDLIYRLIFYGVLFGSLWLAVRQPRRSRKFNRVIGSQQIIISQCWTIVSIGLIFLFPFIPSDLNNSAFFSARLVIFIWIAALLAASAGIFQHTWVRPALASLAILSTALTLWLAHRRINPVAQQLALAEQEPSIPTNSIGLYLYGTPFLQPPLLTYDPYGWNGVRLFRRTDSVLFNTPWLDLPIIPLGPRPVMPTGRLGSIELEFPPALRVQMERSPADRNFVFSQIGVTVLNFGQGVAVSQTDPLLVTNSSPVSASNKPWNCKSEADFAICTP